MAQVCKLATTHRNVKINNRVFNLVLGLGLDFVALQDLDFGGGHLDGDRLGRGSGVVAMAAG